MINASDIRALVEEKIEGTGMFVVELTVSSANRIVIELDSMEGVTIDDCVQVSRHVESSLDRETQDFELQVSSAGIDKPLRDRRQYVKNVGRELRVQLEDGAELKGELLEADEQLKLKLPPSKKKKLPAREELIEWENIKEAKIIISFK
ncbi:MAG: ribosome assembly cofactor RimP [Cryomorphaceae bacterium]